MFLEFINQYGVSQASNDQVLLFLKSSVTQFVAELNKQYKIAGIFCSDMVTYVSMYTTPRFAHMRILLYSSKITLFVEISPEYQSDCIFSSEFPFVRRLYYDAPNTKLSIKGGSTRYYIITSQKEQTFNAILNAAKQLIAYKYIDVSDMCCVPKFLVNVNKLYIRGNVATQSFYDLYKNKHECPVTMFCAPSNIPNVNIKYREIIHKTTRVLISTKDYTGSPQFQYDENFYEFLATVECKRMIIMQRVDQSTMDISAVFANPNIRKLSLLDCAYNKNVFFENHKLIKFEDPTCWTIDLQEIDEHLARNRREFSTKSARR